MDPTPTANLPIPLWQILEAEFRELQGVLTKEYEERRDKCLNDFKADPSQVAGSADAQAAQNNTLLPEIYRLMHDQKLNAQGRRSTALCFSGGGIRSATFNLGVLQALAEAGLLDQFDYLSTVSGGGYVGGWFTSWVARKTGGIASVIKQLRNPVRSPTNPEPDPVHHLRAYSKYLSPRPGVMSVDTWVLVTIYLRNLLVNWVVFVPLLLGTLMIPRVCAAVINIFPILYPTIESPPSPPMAAASVAPATQSVSVDQIVTAVQVTTTLQRTGTPAVKPLDRADRAHGMPTAPPMAVTACFALTAVCVVTAFLYARRRQPSGMRAAGKNPAGPPPDGSRMRGGQEEFLWFGMLPLVLAGIFGSTGWAWLAVETSHHFVYFALFGVLLGLLGGIPALYKARLSGGGCREFIAVLAGGFTAGAAMWVAAALLDHIPGAFARHEADWHQIAMDGQETALYVCIAAPLLLLALGAGATVYIGFSSRLESNRNEDDREWWARAGAWAWMYTVLWPVISALVLFGPAIVLEATGWIKASIISVGGVSGLIAILIGKSGITAAKADGNASSTKRSPISELLLTIAAPVFVCFIIILLSLVTDSLLRIRLPRAGYNWTRCFVLPVPGSEDVGDGAIAENQPDQLHYALLEGFGDSQRAEHEHQRFLRARAARVIAREGTSGGTTQVPHRLWKFLKNDEGIEERFEPMVYRQICFLLFQIGWCGGLLLLGYLVSHQIDLNAFSLHGMYRNRLIRAYLGASRDKDSWDGMRNPNPFTGFDPVDNIPMTRLWQAPAGPARGPLHVVNMALNLVSGKNLAWQERKADSFTVSPLHAGNSRLGYRAAAEYTGKPNGVTLGTSIAISGAAVSPNMGYHSSPFIAFLLTLFNARLGWWWGNPGLTGAETYTRFAPANGAWEAIMEALGQTDDLHPYVYLSDGGHFENLGVYEMVRRRCHSIVVGDAGQDADFGFEDLGNAVRKIYIDMGIRISFTGGIRIYPRKPEPKEKRQGYYCAVASIDYRGVDGEAAVQGELIYIKPAFYGDEPADIYNYARECDSFPHETTANQFFTESQFESYRNLGHHIAQILYPATETNQSVDTIIAGPRANLTMPFLTGIDPGSGASGGTNTVTLQGTFHTNAAEIQVLFKNVRATNLAGMTMDQIRVQAPPSASGTGAVDVTVSYRNDDGKEFGRHTLYHAYRYT